MRRQDGILTVPDSPLKDPAVDVRHRLFRKDYVAIGGAIVAFLILTVLGASPAVTVVAVIVVYTALVSVRNRTNGQGVSSAGDMAERSEVAQEASRQKIANMREQATRIDRESTREIVIRICDQSEQVLETIAERNRPEIAPLYLEQLLEPAEALVDTYVRLSSRGLKATDEMLARYESQDFPMIERAARLFLERLRQEPAADLPALTQLLSFNVDSETQIVQPRR
jgi:hypothetical protein